MTCLVDVAQDDFLHARVLHDLAHNPAIAPANHQDALWVRVAEERHMGYHFLV
jgi:hypothetical protein